MTNRKYPPIADWDQAYDNRNAVGLDVVEAHVAGWNRQAEALRGQLSSAGRAHIDQPYGRGERQRYDLFLPEEAPHGLAIYVHGGYWRSFDKSTWSHLARGPLTRGFATAIPSYTLCPEARIADITREIAAFLEHVAKDIDGPLHLIGHSAGGHLVTRMISGALDRGLAGRIAKVVSVSGVHDLRPLLRTAMNETFHLDLAEARAESPVLLEPVEGTDLTCWVGADELPAFRQQNALLADLWHGLGAKTEVVEAQGKQHFSVIEDLADPSSALTTALLS